MKMNPSDIREKFGDDYLADEYSFIMGIDQRFTMHFAQRFTGLNVLETCTGAGFTTISLARAARHVYTVETDTCRQDKAVSNIGRAGLSSKVSFVQGSILDPDVVKKIPPVDAVFIDPDWAVTGPDHVYRFNRSNTRPPADTVLSNMLEITGHVAIVLPPFVNTREFDTLPAHERESLFMGDSHELFCLYFGKLRQQTGPTEFRVEM